MLKKNNNMYKNLTCEMSKMQFIFFLPPNEELEYIGPPNMKVKGYMYPQMKKTVGGRPHRFPYNNFSSVYQIFTKLGHMILRKWKNSIYFGVIRSRSLLL